MNRTLWRYLPAATDEERAALSRLAAAAPEERVASPAGGAVRVRLSLVVEPPCDGRAAVGVTLSFPDGPEGRSVEEAVDPWGLCTGFLEARLP